MTYAESVRWLYSLTRIGIKPGLATTRRLAELAGNPHERLRFIHVAGTNGKGSTCAFLESVYRRAGLRVGLYTSPHLVSFRERVQVNREPVGETEVAELLARLRALSEKDGLEPTFFEFVTVMALMCFAARGCDLVVLETGMGGRLDSTNIVRPLVSVITSIGIDHAAYLGDTLSEIAGEKAGIIKEGIPVVTITQAPDAAAVLARKALEVGAPMTVIGADTVEAATACLKGEYRRRNANLAGGVTGVLNGCSGMPSIDAVHLKDSFEAAEWIGRLQLVRRRGCEWLLDGAHNEDGFRALLLALPEYAEGREKTLVLGLLGDKAIGGVVSELAAAFERVVIVPVNSARGGDVNGLAEDFRRAGAVVSGFPTLEAGLLSVKTGFAVIAGSFYLVGEALELLEATPAGLASERQLNEYGR